MNKEEKIELIRKYAPVLHFHEDEVYLPSDCYTFVERDNLCRKIGKKVETLKFNHTLEDLPIGKKSEKLFLNMPMLNMNKFDIAEQYQLGMKEIGPSAVAKLARNKFGNNPILGFAQNPRVPMYYARVRNVTIKDRSAQGEPFSKYMKNNVPKVFGNYVVLQYIFYYIFNDSWNKHESDWDSVVEIYINQDTGKKFMISHLHETYYVSEIVPSKWDIRTWIQLWNKPKRKTELKKAYVLINHPYIFVALGAHGGYPTPGFTVHGLDPEIVGIRIYDKVIISVDERQIGKTIIYPPNNNRDLVRTNLANCGIDVNKTHFLEWKNFELLEDQEWLNYMGKWGEDTEFVGYDGPIGPKNKWKVSEKDFKEKLSEGYNGNAPHHTHQNWHGYYS